MDGGGLLARSFGEHFDDDSFDIGEQVVSPFLWSLGVRKLNAKLSEYKRLHGVVLWGQEFPRTASQKIKREELAKQLLNPSPPES